MSNVVRGIAGVALIALSFINPLVGTLTASILFSVGASLALGALSQALAPGKPKVRRNGQELEYVGTVEPRRIIYGTNKVSGMNVIPPWTSGKNNEMLHQVLALAGHQVDDITDVYFGDDKIDDADIGGISNTLASGKVLSGKYKDRAWIRRRVGTVTQAVDWILKIAFPSEWDATHTGWEVPYIALQYMFDEEVYTTGKPEVSCIVRGKKCYDPRDDTGGPGVDPTNSAFASFTNNPALCLADYLTSARLGLGEDPARIDWDLVVAAANICDEQVTVPPASPVTTQKRYTCNVVLEVALTDEDLRDNITLLASAMLGQAVFTTGVWKIYAGAAKAPTFDLNADALAGDFTIRTEVPGNEKYNYVRGQFVDKARAYQLSEFEPRENAAYETEDLGKRLPREVNFLTCTNQYEAQRDAMVILKRSRRRKQLTAKFDMKAFKIRVWDVGTITFDELGWDAQLVRCTSWAFGPDGIIDATFLEEDDADWDDPAVVDYGGAATTGVGVTPGDYIPPEALGFTAYGQVDGILFHYDYPPGHLPGTRAIIYEGAIDTAFAAATKVSPNFLGNTYVLPKSDTDPHDYWITLQNLHAHPPVESDPVGPVRASANALTTGFHVNLTKGTVFTLIQNATFGNSDVITATPVNGTGPYTYAWTAVAGGDPDVTANTDTVAATGFHVKNMNTQGDVKQRRFRIRVTDSTAAHADNYVTATFHRDDGT